MNDRGDELIELTRALQAEERRGTGLDRQRTAATGRLQKLPLRLVAVLVALARRVTENQKRALPKPTSLDKSTGEKHDRGLFAA